MIRKLKKFLKEHYPKPEYSITLLVALAIILLVTPFSIENTRQASLISKWNEKINRIEYMFSVMNAHITDDMLVSLKKAQTAKEREKILLMIIKPYLRINTEKCPIRHYRPKFRSGARIAKDNKYYFEDLYYAENKGIVGIKNINTEKPQDPLFMMMFDINGILPPNRWGNDIFGINIYDDGQIQPFGYDMDIQKLKDDCSKKGTGVGCSYYYVIGGDFDD